MMSTYPEAGETIEGKYRIEGYIGEGGMGAVARATHLLRKAPVALKFMAPSAMYQPGGVERFLNEAVAASALKSEHIVQVLDVGTMPSKAPYLVLELLEGYDAATLLEREGRARHRRTAGGAHRACRCCGRSRSRTAAGIIHRDLKPSNSFLVHHEGDPEFVKLLDFGISKVQREGGASLTQTNTALGTPLYMSPEQARSARDVDFRCDIYSTGVILYELLCGHAPHVVDGGEFTAVLYKLFTSDAPAARRAARGPAAGALRARAQCARARAREALRLRARLRRGARALLRRAERDRDRAPARRRPHARVAGADRVVTQPRLPQRRRHRGDAGRHLVSARPHHLRRPVGRARRAWRPRCGRTCRARARRASPRRLAPRRRSREGEGSCSRASRSPPRSARLR